MAITVKEIYQGTSYTEGNNASLFDRATMVLYVKGLADTRDQLDQAITSAVSGRLVHPDNSSLPLKYSSARWARGDDSGGGVDNAAAVVVLTYGKNANKRATTTAEFTNIADIDVYTAPKFWYGKTLADPADKGDGNGSTEIYETQSPFAPTGPPTYPGHYLTETYMRIRIPVTLSSSPISSSFSTTGKTNSNTFTISGKAFPAESLVYSGLSQRTTRIDDGAAVTYLFEVMYEFIYAAHGWYTSRLYNNSGTLEVVKDLAQDAASFSSGSFPTS